jgi:hypothetical protein
MQKGILMRCGAKNPDLISPCNVCQAWLGIDVAGKWLCFNKENAMARLVVGLFERFDDARDAVEELQAYEYPAGDLNVICGSKAQAVASKHAHAHAIPQTEGATIGAGAGAVMGGAAALLAGLTAFAVPGFGPILAAGTLTAAFAGAGVGAVAGGLVGGLIGLGVSKDDAYTYEQAVKNGGTVVTVRTSDDRYEHAIEIMNRHRVKDVSERAVK